MKKVALITGSGKKRLGWHVAQALAERGYAIALHYRNSAREAAEAVEDFRRQGVDARAFAADLADEAAVLALVQGTLAAFNRIDVLVNCAAIWEPVPLEAIRAAEVRRNFEVNVLGTFLCAQQAGLAMVRQADGGCIVNFGDWAVARPYVNYAAYFASKGAIPALTRCLAVELGTRNPKVRVNCIQPGPILVQPDLPAAEWRQAIQSTLAQREGTPAQIAQTVLYLVDNEFVTGTCVTVDGGRSIYAGGN